MAAAPPPPPASPTPTPAPVTHLTLRRRPARAAAAHLKPVGPVAVAPAAPPPSTPPPSHAHSLRRPRKRRRVDLSEDVPSPASDTYDNKAGAEEAPRVAAEEEEEEEEEEEVQEEEEEEGSEEEGEEEEGGGRRRREQRRERWRECALYREAQRHAGAPSARKTHRQLGIFGLRGFPAEIEHTRDFAPPAWALPRGDLRLGGVDAVLGRETPRRGAGARMGVVASGGVGVGAGGAGKEGGQAHLSAVVMSVTVTGETLLDVGTGKSDAVMTVGTPKTVDSQETEDLMLFS
jgi:hypothetical protein